MRLNELGVIGNPELRQGLAAIPTDPAWWGFLDAEYSEDEDFNELFAEGEIPGINGVIYTPGQPGPHKYDYAHDGRCGGTCLVWEGKYLESVFVL